MIFTIESTDNLREARETYLEDARRLATLARTKLAESGSDPSFDRLARLAAKLLSTPVALISLVDDHRQFFKSCVGLPEPWMSRRETPHSHSFCRFVVISRKPFIVNDARLDPLVKDNPAINDLGVIAYIGVPLLVDGHVIGSFCAIDSKPRSWTAGDLESLTDLTESVVAEIRLRDERTLAAVLANERLAAIVESSDDIIVSKTLDGIITSWNRGAEQILGYTAAEVVGNHVSMLVSPEQVEDIEAILKRIRRGEKVDHYHTRRRRKDGVVIDVSLTVSPIRNEKGEIVGASKVGRDITAQTQAEADRESLVEQLRDQDRRKDEFLAMLAHELRNPLGVISNGVQLVQTVKKPEMLAELGDLIQHQVRHLTHLIDDLLDVSRITQGKIDLRRQTIELASTVNRAVEAVRSLVNDRRHTLTVSLPNEPIRFVADPTRIEQILGNLLTNAAKYSDPGGSIRLSAGIEGDEVVFRVQDTGYGIAADMLPKVFGLFTQVDATIDRSQGGLGIGLTLVRSLVEMHGGSVAAASEGKGKGAEFTVRLPIGQPQAENDRAAAKPSEPRTGTGRVLVIDDNIETVRLTARMLKHHGYQVETAFDGHQAVELARRFHPNVILLDIGLPGMNGYEVAHLLNQEECCRSAQFIAISGYGESRSRERSREAGFHHHLIKPLDFDRLMELIG